MYCRWSAVSPHRRQGSSRQYPHLLPMVASFPTSSPGAHMSVCFRQTTVDSNRLLTGIGSRLSVRSLLGSIVTRKNLLGSTVKSYLLMSHVAPPRSTLT